MQKKTLDDNGVDVLVVTCTGSGLSFKAPGMQNRGVLASKQSYLHLKTSNPSSIR